MSFEGRKLSEEEEQQIISAIESNTSIEILCIVENGTRQEAVTKEQVEAFYDAVQQQYENAAAGNGPEQFYRGTLRSGQVIRVDRVSRSLAMSIREPKLFPRETL